jgi:hypothetical protein
MMNTQYRFSIQLLFLTFIILAPLSALNDLEIGSPAPDFSLPCIGSEKPVVLSDYMDKKIVIVHFWKSK